MMIDRCPSTLKPGFETYSPAALRKVFQGKKVSHRLPFASDDDESVQQIFSENRKRLSISGVQKKISFKLEKNRLQLTERGEYGHYILKPIPDALKKVDQVPANEHVTMQIAEQLFGIQTAANALIFFQDAQPAYITKRFDYKADGTKRSMEDFATLAGKSKDSAGEDFKYEGSVEDLFRILKRYVGPYLIEAQKLFRLVLFNYTFSNGDAHLKNFSLLETDQGDLVLSPAYDLICTRVHVNDPDVAFKDGLFTDFETASFSSHGFYTHADFLALGQRTGLPENFVKKEIDAFLQAGKKVETMVRLSFMNKELQDEYLALFQAKCRRLSTSR